MPDMRLWPTGRLLSTAARLLEHAWNEKLNDIGLNYAGLITLDVLAANGPTTPPAQSGRAPAEQDRCGCQVSGSVLGGHWPRRRNQPAVRPRALVRQKMTDHDAAPTLKTALEPPMCHWLYALSDGTGLAANGRPGKTCPPIWSWKNGEREELGEAIQSVTDIIQFMVYVHPALKDLNESLRGVISESSYIPGDVNGHRIELEYRMLIECAAIRKYEEHTNSRRIVKQLNRSSP